MTGEQVTTVFFIICGIVVIVALVIMGLVFLIATVKRLEEPEIQNAEYIIYMRKGYVLRFCYGYCVAADILLKVLEIAATATGAFIALIPDTPSYLVAFLLIVTFFASSVQNALNLKNARSAYARAFRILEFATDDYRISNRDWDAKKKLHEANEKAQKIIEDFVE